MGAPESSSSLTSIGGRGEEDVHSRRSYFESKKKAITAKIVDAMIFPTGEREKETPSSKCDCVTPVCDVRFSHITKKGGAQEIFEKSGKVFAAFSQTHLLNF